MKTWINRWQPCIASLIIPLFSFFLFWVISSPWNWRLAKWEAIITVSIGLILFLSCWAFFAILAFPRIIVTIKNKGNPGGPGTLRNITVWSDGRKVFEKKIRISLPLQFSFQVWRRGVYDLHTGVKGEGALITEAIKKADTYDHKTCHIVCEIEQVA